MNKERRTSLKKAIDLLDRAIIIINSACEAEQDCLDNMPENLQDSDRCIRMEEAIDNLESALEKIDEAKDCVTAASV